MSARSGAARSPERHASPKHAPRARPTLRIVDQADLRGLRPGRVGTLALVFLFAALFALAAFQTVIIKTQSHLDDVNGQITVEESRARDLALSLADLRSPARITTEATDRLGMVAPGEITYLRPAVDDDDRAALVEPPPDPAP